MDTPRCKDCKRQMEKIQITKENGVVKFILFQCNRCKKRITQGIGKRKQNPNYKDNFQQTQSINRSKYIEKRKTSNRSIFITNKLSKLWKVN